MLEQPGPNFMYIAYNSGSQTINLCKREIGKKQQCWTQIIISDQKTKRMSLVIKRNLPSVIKCIYYDVYWKLLTSINEDLNQPIYGKITDEHWSVIVGHPFGSFTYGSFY